MNVAAAAKIFVGVLVIGLSAPASAFLPIIMGAGAAMSGIGAGAAVAGASAVGAGMAAKAGSAAATSGSGAIRGGAIGGAEGSAAATDGTASAGVNASEVLQSGADSAASTVAQHAVDSAMRGGGNVEATDKSCQADEQRYCAQSGGGNKSLDCLLDHQQDVSDACYASLKKQIAAEKDANRKAVQRDESGSPPAEIECRRDIRRYCGDIRPGGGRIMSCLHSHQKDLSDGCYDAMTKQM